MFSLCSKENYSILFYISVVTTGKLTKGLKLHQISHFPGLCPKPSLGSLQALKVRFYESWNLVFAAPGKQCFNVCTKPGTLTDSDSV